MSREHSVNKNLILYNDFSARGALTDLFHSKNISNISTQVRDNLLVVSKAVCTWILFQKYGIRKKLSLTNLSNTLAADRTNNGEALIIVNGIGRICR